MAYSRVEYRALEGFVLAVSPFNFTAIGGNLPGGMYLFSFHASLDVSLILPQHPRWLGMLWFGNPPLQLPTRITLFTKFLPRLASLLVSFNLCLDHLLKSWRKPSDIPILQRCISLEARLYSRNCGKTSPRISINIKATLGLSVKLVERTFILFTSRQKSETRCSRVSGEGSNTKVSHTFRHQTKKLDSIAGQKCSALSRLYVSSSVWNGGFKDQFLGEIAKIKVGAVQDFAHFMGPVM